MVIVRLLGGLGNQLFQYSLGRHLAIKNKTELKLDISGFEIYKKHKYSLNHFNIIENFASADEIRRYKKFNDQTIKGKFYNLIESLKPPKLRTYIKEPYPYGFFPEILSSGDNIYLDGYWQSEKYFKAVEPIMRREFTVKEAFDSYLFRAITDSNSVSLHVRRTDYVTNSRAYKIHGTCSVDYYERAANKIKKTVSQPHFFIFSDDIDWAKNNLKLKASITFVEHGPEKNYEDLILMSKCKHNIIANSSFSWWGAWLNQNPTKIVIAPQKWFKDAKMSTNDLLPINWLKI